MLRPLLYKLKKRGAGIISRRPFLGYVLFGGL